MKLLGILAIMFALLLASLPVAFSLGSLGPVSYTHLTLPTSPHV